MTTASHATSAASDAGAAGALVAASGPLLSLIIVLRRAKDLDAFGDIRGTVARLVEDLRTRARMERMNPRDVDDVIYALAATIDETLLMADWSGRSPWAQEPLARRYCNDEFVGVGFFDKLEALRLDFAARRDVVEVFYYCLVAGFRGRMAEDPAAFDRLMSALSADLQPGSRELSPDLGAARGGRLRATVNRFPFIWIFVVLGATVFIFYLVASLYLASVAT